jgi:flagellar M-ring protein FliF
MNFMGELWGAWSRGARIGFVSGVLAILVLTSVAIWWVLRTNYAMLFKELQPQDAATVVSELKRMKVEHRIADGGGTVLVPEELVAGTRLELMGSSSKFSGGVGLELFDQSDFGMTEFAQRINYQRALQGELSRTISSLREVKSARVHLVLPESGLFAQKKEPARASVTLFVKENATVGAGQILGIQRLVAASVPGLDAERVTVLGQDGVVLSAPVVVSANGELLSGYLEKQREVEGYLRQKVVDLLSRDFGPESFEVSVNVTLNFDQVKITREDVVPAPNSGVVRKRENKASSGMTPVQKGESSVVEYEYQLGREINQTIVAPGDVRQINVGVLLPADVTENQVHKVRELVSTVLALSEDRGDQIAVHRMQHPGAASERVFGMNPSTTPFPEDSPARESATVAPDVQAGNKARSNSELRERAMKTTTRTQLMTLLHTNGAMLAGLGIAVVAALVLMILFWSRPRGKAATPEEREKMLADVRQWLKQPALDAKSS